MDPITSGALISGGLGLAGSIGGSVLGGRSNDRAAAANAQIQRELAQNGLSWRVADAKRAGINPLAALGASIPSGSPVAVGQDYGDLGLGALGQDISRAMTAKMTAEQREIHELNKEMLRAQIEGQKLDNQAKLDPPVLPSPGNIVLGTPNPLVDVIKDDVRTSKQPGVLAATQPKYVDYINEDGELERKLNQNLMDAQEDDWDTKIRSYKRMFNDSVGGVLSKYFYPDHLKFAEKKERERPPHPQKGWEYRWNRKRQTWVPHKLAPGEKSQIFDTPSGSFDKWYRRRNEPWTMDNYIRRITE